MAAVIFKALSNLRFAIETETDADSPDNETTYADIREAIEILYKLCFSDGFTSTASANPPDDNTGVLTHAGAAQTVDEHNGRTLMITSGNARGNFYTIDDTTAQTIICTGDNLYSDGVRSGDDFEIFYDIKTNSDGHDHDSVNSKSVSGAAAGTIGQAELNTTSGEVSEDGGTANELLPGGSYGFYPEIKEDGVGKISVGIASAWSGAAYSTRLYMDSTVADGTIGWAQQTYVTASGRIHWVFVLRHKVTKKIQSTWQSPDHPCFGNGGKPALCPHPWVGRDNLGDYDILVINPTKQQVEAIKEETIVEDEELPDKGFTQAMFDLYEIDELSPAEWPTEPISVGLPKNWRELPMGSPVKSIDKKIKQPKDVKVLKLKDKGV